MTRAGIYCRISSDREHDGLGVARQQQDCETLANNLGWDIARTYIDNDKSAYSGKRRPEYEQLLAAVEQHELDAIIAWHPDRLHRSPTELERFIDLIDRHRIHVATVQAGHVDLTTPTGRMTARVVGAVARHESEHKSERVRRKHLELARAGKPSGGRRGYGYRAVLNDLGKIDRIELVAHEVALIHEAVDRVLNGEGARSICTDWRARQIPTTDGADWTQGSLKRILTSPRIAGMRAMKGVDVVEAEWPPIITYDTLLRVRAAFEQRASLMAYRPRRYLLAGLAVCGNCETKMVSRPTGKGVRRYVCAADRGGCARVGIDAQQLEDLIVEATLRRLERSRPVLEAMTRNVNRSDDVAAELADINKRVEELATLWAAGELSAVEWEAARSGLIQRRQAAEERIASSVVNGALTDLVGLGGDLRAVWDGFSFDHRRAVLVAVLKQVSVAKTSRGNNRFDPRRVRPAWRI